MAIVTTDDKYYTEIANAIRNKNGTTTQYKPSEMAAAINAISIGGGGIGLSNINSSITYPLHVIGADNYDSTNRTFIADGNFDTSSNISGYSIYFSSSTSVVAQKDSDIITDIFIDKDWVKLRGGYAYYGILYFVIGGSYATEHSSTSYNLYKLSFFDGYTYAYNNIYYSNTELFFIKAPSLNYNGILKYPTVGDIGNITNEGFPSKFPKIKWAIEFNEFIQKDILMYCAFGSDSSRFEMLFTSASSGLLVPTVTEYYSG